MIAAHLAMLQAWVAHQKTTSARAVTTMNARVSTGEHTLDLQLDALKKARCGKVYTETASGAKAKRPI